MVIYPSSQWMRKERLYVLLIVLLALLLRAGLATLPRVIRWDEPDYLWLGKSLWSGAGYTINGVPELHYTPLLPILAGGVYWLTNNPELGTTFWYTLLGGLLVVPVYALARRLYGVRVGLISAVLVALFPGLSGSILYWGTMTEPLFILLIYAGLWATLLALEHETWWRFALLGGLLALAYLARPEGLIWILALTFFLVLVWLFQRRLLRWRTSLYLATLISTCVLIMAPYLLFIHSHTGKWMPTGKLAITYDIGEAVLENDPALYDIVTASLDETTGEILWWSGKRFERSMWDIMLEDPARFVARTGRNAVKAYDTVFAGNVFPFVFILPILLGWVKSPWSRERLRREALLCFGVLPVLAFLPFHVEIRFFSPAFPVLIMWLAAGLVALGEWVEETVGAWTQRPTKGWGTLLLAGVLMAYLGWMQVRVVERGMASLNYGHKVAAFWLRAQAPADVAVMSRDLAISLYAERGFVVSPRAEYQRFLEYGRQKGASYLVVDERELRELRPHLAFLLDESDSPPELEFVFRVDDPNGRTLIYRIRD
jgi:4-amino-4-deoxy-L-arabinose transferase-like glycosyltransferase